MHLHDSLDGRHMTQGFYGAVCRYWDGITVGMLCGFLSTHLGMSHNRASHTKFNVCSRPPQQKRCPFEEQGSTSTVGTHNASV